MIIYSIVSMLNQMSMIDMFVVLYILKYLLMLKAMHAELKTGFFLEFPLYVLLPCYILYTMKPV